MGVLREHVYVNILCVNIDKTLHCVKALAESIGQATNISFDMAFRFDKLDKTLFY